MQSLIHRDQSLLLLIDVQEKLAPLCDDSTPWLANIEWLLKIATKLNIERMATEQYPIGLSHTLPQLQPYFQQPILDKVHFSCAADAHCWQAIKNIDRNQAILIGIETHVCIMQTAFECLEQGMQVFVVVDAVSARHRVDHKTALKRMSQAGITLVTREMVVFEWLRQAGTAEFKAISKEFLR